MAFEKGNFSLLALRVLPGCEEHLKKILQEEWYLFNDWYELKDGALKKRENASLERNMYGCNISVSAIVGKNGSGKSALMEMIFRLVNNLSFCMMQGFVSPAARPLYFIEGVEAELYFESQGQMGKLSCHQKEVAFIWGDDDEISYKVDRLSRRLDNNAEKQLAYISRHFCFNLVSNYAMMSLNPGDYGQDIKYAKYIIFRDGNWLDSVYNKNDGYTAAIGIEPFKGEGIIDLNNQRKLCKARVAGLLIETGRNGVDFFDGYSYHSIELKYDSYFLLKKTNDPQVDYIHGGNHFNLELPHLLDNQYCFASVILDAYGLENLNRQDTVEMMAAAYLAYKTLRVAQIYPKYKKYSRFGKTRYFAKDTRTFDRKLRKEMIFKGVGSEETVVTEHELQNLVYELKSDQSHITLKIRQTLHFLEAIRLKSKKEGKGWRCPEVKNYDEYMELFEKSKLAHIFENSDNIMEYFPPPFFEASIYLSRKKKEKGDKKEKILYERLSTGEQQFIQTTVSMIYHAKNIASVVDAENAVKYYNINIFIDEIEACFHPEYQQKFIKLFLGMIKGQGLSEKCNFNIIIATHSPFILSDIPKQNVVYLDNGKCVNREEMINPFCGNVCDLLRHSFFLKSGFMGEWAKDMVNDLIVYLRLQNDEELTDHTRNSFEWNKVNAKEFINMIGEPMLKGSLMNKYSEVFGCKDEELLAWHQAEIDRLTKRHKQ